VTDSSDIEFALDIHVALATADCLDVELRPEEVELALFGGRVAWVGEARLYCECPSSPRDWGVEQLPPKARGSRMHRQNWRKFTWQHHADNRQSSSLPCFPPDWPERGIVP
jgi:hypothetical protein